MVCSYTWTSYEPIWDAFIVLEYDWLIVESNALCRQSEAPLSKSGKQIKIPFFCQYCNEDFVDKAHLGWHRQMDQCEVYDGTTKGQLKIYLYMGLGGNKEARATFRKYNMVVPWQMIRMKPKTTQERA